MAESAALNESNGEERTDNEEAKVQNVIILDENYANGTVFGFEAKDVNSNETENGFIIMIPDNGGTPPPIQRCPSCVRFYLAFDRIYVKVRLPVFSTVALLVSTAAVVLGLYYFHQCPLEPMVPIFLIVMGVVSIVVALIFVYRGILMRRILMRESCWKFTLRHPCLLVIDLFLCAWFIAGCVWVFKNNPPQYTDPAVNEKYCEKDLIDATFAFLKVVVFYFSAMVSLQNVHNMLKPLRLIGAGTSNADSMETQ